MRTLFWGVFGGAGCLCGMSCSDASGVAQRAAREARVGSLYTAMVVGGQSSDVTAVRFDVVAVTGNCDDSPIYSEEVSLEPSSDEARGVANSLFVLPVGEYRLCASPLNEGAPSEECEPTAGEAKIESDVTTALELVSQCSSGSQGALGAVVTLNQAPSIVRIELDPSTSIRACESLRAVASASDPNGDDLTYEWSLTAGPSGGELLSETSEATFSGPAGEYSITIAISDGLGGTDSLEFAVSVTDGDCAGNIDISPPGGITELQALIESRRETSVRLSWSPPDETVAGYHVAYLPLATGEDATVIDDASFEAASRAPDVSGQMTTTVIHDLIIEKPYLFAVRPYDSAGNLGPVVSTSEALHAEFQTLVLSPPPSAGPGTQWGFSVDASTDLNGDGTADLVVGQKYGDQVYIYLGETGGTYATTPDAVIVGPPGSGFGASLSVIGNLVGGGHEDIAIAAPNDGPVLGRVYIVSGREWDGDTVDLSDGTNPTGAVIDFPTTSPYPAHVVRLGDFDGDGDSDFGIHALGYGPTGACDPETLMNCEGAFLLIKGVSNPSNFPAVVTVPEDEPLFEAYFPSTYGFYGGDWLLGVTNLVEGKSGVLAAEYQAGVQRLITRNTGESDGFDAQVLDYGPPEFVQDSLVYDTEIGSYPAALVGSSQLAIALTNARDGLGTTPGIVDLYSLSPTETFVSPQQTFKAGGETNNFGQILIGNRYSGRDSSYSLPFFGREAQAPALIAGGRYFANKLPKLFMLTAQTLATTPPNDAGQELTGAADVEYLLSSVVGVNPDWTDDLGVPSDDADWHGGLGFAIHDMNRDGFADIGVAEWEFDAAYTGGIIILY